MRNAGAIQVFSRSYICGELRVAPGLSGVVSAADERGLLNVVFRRFAERLRQLGVSLDSEGDTSGSRFRSGAAREQHCNAAADIELVISVAPGSPGGPEPPASRPPIEPYKLSLSLRQGDARASREIARRRGDANPGVITDSRTADVSRATAASITNDIAELATSLAASLVKGA
jgi:hypothetical protein